MLNRWNFLKTGFYEGINATSFELVFETKLDLKGGDLASVSDCRRSRSVRGESGATTLMRPSLRSSPSSMCASGARAGLRAARLHLFLCVALRHSVADARLGEDVLRAAGLLARALLSDDFVYLAERARRIRGVLETRTETPYGNPLLGRGIWSVRPIRAGRGSKFARAMRWRS